MRRRLLLLLCLCVLLVVLRALPENVVPASDSSEWLVWIDIQAMSLTLYQNGEQAGKWPIAGGTNNTPTPIGVYRISRRFVPEPGSFGTRFLMLTVPWGQYGIHGTNLPGSIGSRASHGCIRMFNQDVEALFRLVPNWTRVVIEDGPYGNLGWTRPNLSYAARGSHVVAVQQRLLTLGYYQGSLDGVYGPNLLQALKRFKQDNSLPATDTIDQKTWDALGLVLFE